MHAGKAGDDPTAREVQARSHARVFPVQLSFLAVDFPVHAVHCALRVAVSLLCLITCVHFCRKEELQLSKSDKVDF